MARLSGVVNEEPVPAGAQVADALRVRITEGGLPPGTQLRDTALAAEFGIARHTLRNALRQLEYEGLISYRMHKGAVVKTLSTEDVHEIYRVRRTLELAAVQQSALAGSAALRGLEERVRAAEVAVAGESWNTVGTASLRFHQALVELLGSRSIDRFFQGILAQLRLAFAVMPDEAQWQPPWIPRDREICDLVRGGQRGAATAATRQYLEDSELAVLDVVRADEMNGRK
ncbi:GntR family transcriptional regulator [Sciscionella sediminilitoris]|uniref:GntR family transcriptional regulator n=1 Tax=Sciscionella sediminilitoris TaxID=1445613 RepID=UPI0004DF38C9|nr:GntR family transcriptional regulator [Sciscionella sp. SE31]